MSSYRTVEFLFGGVPFVLPAAFVVKEESSSFLEMAVLGTNSLLGSFPARSVSNTLNVTLSFATGTEFFLNSYSLFKGVVEAMCLLQASSVYPDVMKFSSYIGIAEMMPIGQLRAYNFSHEPQKNNMVVVNLSFERKNRRSGSQGMASPESVVGS